jgi:hypothetical protein
MPGLLLHFGAAVECEHGGIALPILPFPRVTVSGQPVVLQTDTYTVAACAFTPPEGNGPCITAQWLTATTRVLAGGFPVLLNDSEALCIPTSTGLIVIEVQPRVTGQ